MIILLLVTLKLILILNTKEIHKVKGDFLALKIEAHDLRSDQFTNSVLQRKKFNFSGIRLMSLCGNM